MTYYKENGCWTLYGERLTVVDDNEHLGLIVSGSHEEQKNVDRNITKCRKSLFSLLGVAFAYKCKLSPIVQVKMWRIYSLPVLLSGLPALPIRSTQIKTLAVFHHKILRGILKLSQSSPVPAIYFLLGELPVEATLHIRTLMLFHNLCTNPDTTVNTMAQYILKMCKANSTTWCNHINLLCQQYGLPPPLELLNYSHQWSKESWKQLVSTRITAWHERNLRKLAENNSKMRYLNVKLHGLTGRPHQALLDIRCTQDVEKLRIHLKFLSGDFPTNERKAKQNSALSPSCAFCFPATPDSYEHILTSCRATYDLRERLYPELMIAVADVYPVCSLLLVPSPPTDILTQFLLDCCSINLPSSVRLPHHLPNISKVFRVARDWCYGSVKCRLRLQATPRN